MSRSSNFNEDSMAKAFAAAMSQKKPNISKIAREFDVSRETLASRIKSAKSPTSTGASRRYALQADQENALLNWVGQMISWNLPPTPALIQAWANRTLERSGQAERQVSKMWAYRFIKRLPDNMSLTPVKQKTKELKRIQAEDAGLLAHWYDQLESLLHSVPARLVYNFASQC
ncbi:transposase [Penicillium malachiteum]|uniref:transposase n=1 Tax=Penicillium malachiteum TaxID=1324776 RepID=UPI002547706D|nr:transposase [Penicillium malachiteum]KAJ5715987.1 transposase [Penicillium malachiteum]